jgi:flagellar biogenesis protein FliO
VVVQPGKPAASSKPAAKADYVDPESLPVEAYRAPQAAEKGSSGNLFTGMVGNLALVVALIFGCAAGWKKLQGMPALQGMQKAAPAAEVLEGVETFSLGPQRQLHVVRICGHRLLLGSTPQSVTLIADLDLRQATVAIPEAVEPEADAEAAPSRYSEIMERLRSAGVEIPAEAPAPAPEFEAPRRGVSGLFSTALEDAGVPAPRARGLFRSHAANGAFVGAGDA